MTRLDQMDLPMKDQHKLHSRVLQTVPHGLMTVPPRNLETNRPVLRPFLGYDPFLRAGENVERPDVSSEK